MSALLSKVVDLPTTYIDGDYCICFSVEGVTIRGAETYSQERAQELANHRISHSSEMFWVEVK